MSDQGSNPYAGSSAPMKPEDEKLWSILTHLSTLVSGLVLPLIAYLVLKDRGPFIQHHTREALNFSISMTLYAVVLSITIIGLVIVWIVPVVALIFAILAAVKANAGEMYRYPLTIRFLKA